MEKGNKKHEIGNEEKQEHREGSKDVRVRGKRGRDKMAIEIEKTSSKSAFIHIQLVRNNLFFFNLTIFTNFYR